jgi:hypothetical protein
MENISRIFLEEVDWMKKKNGDEGKRITKKKV